MNRFDKVLMKRTDTQVVELAGRHWLVGQLLTFGFEVAEPVRDRGVDLIVYEERVELFRSVPVQVKASSSRGFSVHDKYLKTRNLVLAYVWNIGLRDGKAQQALAYVMTVEQAEGVAKKMGWARAGRKGYSTTNPSRRLIELLDECKYISSRDRWVSLLRGGS